MRKAQIKNRDCGFCILGCGESYDMLWKEGLLINMHLVGIRGNMFHWVMDFLNWRSIEVKIGLVTSRKNGTPQGSQVQYYFIL